MPPPGITIFVLSIAAVILILILTHLRPLTRDEVVVLSTKRRQKRIREYFSFSRAEWRVDTEFKRRMKPDGRFYPANESLRDSPNVLAALLKYKKHEWIIAAFERNQRVILLWANKGFDREG